MSSFLGSINCTFNYTFNSKKEGITYEVDDQEAFKTFLGKECYDYSDSDFFESDDNELPIDTKQILLRKKH